MRFRVTAVQDEGLPQGFEDAKLWLEEWLTKMLAADNFGWPHGCVMVVVFASIALTAKPSVSRLSGSSGGAPTLALHVRIDPQEIERTARDGQLPLLCRRVCQQLPLAPLRKPKGLEYGRLRSALLACIQPIAQSAA
jgi:hypothetical protein